MDTLKTALTTAFTGVKTDTLDIMGVALPAALGIVSVVMAVRIGINFFKSIAQALGLEPLPKNGTTCFYTSVVLFFIKFIPTGLYISLC